MKNGQWAFSVWMGGSILVSEDRFGSESEAWSEGRATWELLEEAGNRCFLRVHLTSDKGRGKRGVIGSLRRATERPSEACD